VGENTLPGNSHEKPQSFLLAKKGDLSRRGLSCRKVRAKRKGGEVVRERNETGFLQSGVIFSISSIRKEDRQTGFVPTRRGRGRNTNFLNGGKRNWSETRG